MFKPGDWEIFIFTEWIFVFWLSPLFISCVLKYKHLRVLVDYIVYTWSLSLIAISPLIVSYVNV